MLLFFDIETIPNKETELDFVLKYGDEKQVSEMGLFPEFGKIACISCGYEKVEGVEIEFIQKNFIGDEKQVLAQFFGAIENPNVTMLCGFNISNFDIPFVFKRALVHGLKVPKVLSTYDGNNGGTKKPREIQALDIMTIRKSTGSNNTSLDIVCKTLGIPSPKQGGIDGSKVAELYESRDFEEIARYCDRDVKACYDVYKKIIGLI